MAEDTGYKGYLPEGVEVTEIGNVPTRKAKPGDTYAAGLSPSEGKTFFTNEAPGGTVAGDKSQEWGNIITKFEDLPPEIQRVVAMNAKSSSSAGEMSPQQYLDARGGIVDGTGSYGDTPSWRALNKAERAEVAAAGGTSAAYNAAMDKKMYTSLTANPSLLPDPRIKSMVSTGMLTPQEGARVFIQSWGKPASQMLQAASAVARSKLQVELVKQRDDMIKQMREAGYPQVQIDAQLRASFGDVLGPDGKAAPETIDTILGKWNLG